MAAEVPQPWTYNDILSDVIRLKQVQYTTRHRHRVGTLFKPFHREELFDLGTILGTKFDHIASDRRRKGRFPRDPLAPDVAPREETKKMQRVANRLVTGFYMYVEIEDINKRNAIQNGLVVNWLWRNVKLQELLDQEILKFTRRIEELDREEEEQQEQERQQIEVEVIQIDSDGDEDDDDDNNNGNEAENEEDDIFVDELEVVSDEEDDMEDFDDEDDEDDEDEEEEEDEEDEDDEEDENGNGEDDDNTAIEEFYKVYALVYKRHQACIQHEIEQSARGLPAEIILPMDQTKLINAVCERLFEPDNHEKLMKELSDLEEERKYLQEKPFRRPGQFQLPDHVRDRLKIGEIQVIESSIDLLRDALIKGMEFPGMGIFRLIGEIARESGATKINEQALAHITEFMVQTDDFKRRFAEFQEKPKWNCPEAQTLYTPHISGSHWRLWTKMEEPEDQEAVRRPVRRRGRPRRRRAIIWGRPVRNDVQFSDEEEEEDAEDEEEEGDGEEDQEEEEEEEDEVEDEADEENEEDDEVQVNEEPEDQDAVRPPRRRPGRPRRRRAIIWGRPVRNDVQFFDEEEEEEEEEEEGEEEGEDDDEEDQEDEDEEDEEDEEEEENDAVPVGRVEAEDNGGDEEDDEEDEEDEEEEEEEDEEDQEEEEDEEEDELEDQADEENEEDLEDEDEEDDEEGDEEYDDYSVPSVFSFYFQIKKVLNKHQLERSARGLPVQEIPQFDPGKIAMTVCKLFTESDVGPDGPFTPAQDKFLDHWIRMMDLVEEMTEEEPEIRMEKPHRQPGQFKLPENIRERLRTVHVQVLESSIDLLRDALVKGMKFDGLKVFSEINELVNKDMEMEEDDFLLPEGELEDAINIIVRTDDEIRRRKAYEEMDRHHLRTGREKIQLPEAQILHLPRIPREDWRCWTKEDVLDWIKYFIPLQAHRELIEVQHFTGKQLDKFLKSEQEWVEAGWPFGLYIRIRSHFNRVVNRYYRFPYLVR
ncbi:hypothetical protein CAEBREN_18253 [Caenorhabditis brenneri]|uniref:Uncharacterized protein n=1 Tax=Caenorhabditis brenneri TaxID=135651 RepID=G0PDK9_CAEBE|nr:hypothetical protein CAEBREN_18253 [Caenorhabditis brenneri]